ncbi:MAG: response regulator [Methylococcales bacterium]|nr:response regulator [Methylococcales bacterium]
MHNNNFYISENRIILDCSSTVSELLGYLPDELLNKESQMIFPENFLSNDKPSNVQRIVAKHKQGHDLLINILVTQVVIRTPVWVVRVISKNDHAIATLQGMILSLLQSEVSLIKIFRQISDQLKQSVACYPHLFLLFDEDNPIICQSSGALDLMSVETFALEIQAKPENLQQYKTITRNALLKDYPRLGSCLEVLNVPAVISYPVHDKELLIGAIIVFIDNDFGISKCDFDLLEVSAFLATHAFEHKQAEQLLKVSYDTAMNSAKLKSEFLANMSHEIRTPMNGVLGMLSLLEDTEIDDEQKSYVSLAQNSGNSLLAIINDILDVSKMEAGKLEIQLTEFDIRVCVQDLVEINSVKAQENDVDIAYLIDAEVPALVNGDPTRVRQVITNLLGNAVKFTDFGEIIVSVGVTEEDDEHIELRVEVSDTGVGISPDAQKKIFEPFSQEDGADTRKYGGTGLGLTISKQLIEKMGGKIGVISELDHGSIFWFTIKLKKVCNTIASMPVETSLDQLKILVVDRDEANKMVLNHHFSQWNIAFEEVNTPEEAFNSFYSAIQSDKPFDVVIFDMFISDEMDGIEFVTKLKEKSPPIGTRYIILTSFGKQGDGKTAMNNGIYAYFTKPVRPKYLYECLLKIQTEEPEEIVSSAVPVVKKENSTPLTEEKPAKIVTEHSLNEEIYSNKISVLVVEDHLVNQKVVVAFLSKMNIRAEVVNDGSEAVNVVQDKTFDLILMDCQMPVMDGYEATEKIRELEKTTGEHTIIIAMTASTMPGDKENCLAIGMDDYASKPISIKILVELLTKYFSDKFVIPDELYGKY